MALAISCGNPPVGTIGSPYTASPSASGGTAPYTYALTVGSLPPGLSLSTSTGAITGLPRLKGTFTFTLQVTDNVAATATVQCSISALVPSTVPASAFALRKVVCAMKPDPHLTVRGAL